MRSYTSFENFIEYCMPTLFIDIEGERILRRNYRIKRTLNIITQDIARYIYTFHAYSTLYYIESKKKVRFNISDGLFINTILRR